jgi:hypothetical protein
VVNRLHTAKQAGEPIQPCRSGGVLSAHGGGDPRGKSGARRVAEREQTVESSRWRVAFPPTKLFARRWKRAQRKAGVAFYCPAFEFCTDNAAMWAPRLSQAPAWNNGRFSLQRRAVSFHRVGDRRQRSRLRRSYTQLEK